MFKNRIIIGAGIIGAAILLSGCGEYEKLLKSRDFQKKYETGIATYEEGEYVKAATGPFP